MFLTAVVQLRSTTDVEANWKVLEEQVLRAAKAGAQLIVTPENSLFLGPQFHKIDQAQPLTGAICKRLADLADRADVYLLIGSVAEQVVLSDGALDQSRCYNTSLLFSKAGDLMASYRKIHLFDVDVAGGLSIKESDTIKPGEDLVVVDTELGRIGMSICYDLRFPEMYRKLVDLGAELIVVPSAFTLTTGKDHWHPLLRARAIETQTWILAPGQWGTHDEEGKRKSYGHSLIIDPWGVVRADCGEGVSVGYAEIDLDYMRTVRASIPVAQHRRV